MTSERGSLSLISRREALWVAAGSLLFSIVFLYPMLCEVGYLGPGSSGWISTGPVLDHFRRFPSNGDWDLFTQLRWVPYYTITHFHQIPFWNPYKCGGMGMLSNPESSVVSPALIPYLLFGQHAGLYIEIVIHLALAFSGGYVLARSIALGPIAAIVSAVVFPSSSWLYLHLAVGHLNFLPALYIPWIVALFLISIDRRKLFPAALGGLLCALTLTEGNYTFLYTAIIIGSLGLVLALLRLSIWPLLSGLVIGILGIGFSALKLIPMSQQLTIYPKNAFGLEAITPRLISGFLLSRHQDLYHPSGAEFLFSEYGAYISGFFVALAVIGLVCRPIKTLPWLLPALIFFLFAQGFTGNHSPALLIRFLPLSASAGLTGRYLIPFVFCVGVIAAYGADVLASKFEPWGKWIAILLLTFGLADSWLLGPPNLRYLFHNDIEQVDASRDFRQYWVPNPGIQTEISQANMGSVNCQGYGYSDIPESALGYNQTGYRGEYYLLEPGEVRQTLWTPNRLRYEVNVSGPSSLVVNQNYFPGWRLSSGNGELYSKNGLIAVRIPPGRNRIELVYAPEHILLAFALTIAALAALILIWRTEAQN